MIGLEDCGEIATAQPADLVHLRMVGDTPSVLGAWRAGERIA